MMRKIISILLAVLMLTCLLPTVSAESGSKLVALTFDDGPGPYTQRLLDGLAEHNAKATFFCLGERTASYPDVVARIVAEGHQVANHSFSHPNLNELSAESALAQLTRTDDALNKVTGGSGAYFCRAPYGNSSEGLRKIMSAPLIQWSVDTLDWQVRNTKRVTENILRDTYDGSIVLLHDIHAFSVDGVLAALDTLEERGYEFVTVKELMRRRGIMPENGVVYYDCRPGVTDPGPLSVPAVTVETSENGVTVTMENAGDAPIYYTLDGSPVSMQAQQYTDPVETTLPCTIRAVSALDLNGSRSDEFYVYCTMPSASEPHVESEKGLLRFTSGKPGERVFYFLDDGEVLEAANTVRLPGTTWFSFYEGGEGLMPTTPKRYLLTEEGNLFSDVDPNQWYYSALDHAAAEGWMQGSGDGAMRPEQKMTRGMLAALLWRMEGSPETDRSAGFTDVEPDAYYAPAVDWACAAGIFQGGGDGTFSPDRPLTRQELAKVLYAWLEEAPAETEIDSAAVYEDEADIAVWAKEAVARMAELGVMEGSGGCFRPKQTTNRAQVAAVLVRAYSLR